MAKLLEICCRWRVEDDSAHVREADVIIAQSFGIGPGASPGLSNEDMADAVYALVTRLRTPCVLQWEVADALMARHNVRAQVRITDHRQPGAYLDTQEVLEQTVEFCRRNGLTTAIIIAHPLHAWRVAKVAEKLGLKCIVPTIKVRCDSRSSQWWTRGELRFIARELPARLFYWYKGWI